MRVHVAAVMLALNGLAYADPIPAVKPTYPNTYSLQSLTSSLSSSSSFTTSILSSRPTTSSSTTSSTSITSSTSTSTSTSSSTSISTSTTSSTTSSTTTSSSTTDTSTSSTTTTPICTPTHPAIGATDSNGWQYQGCQTDTPDHILYPGPVTLAGNTFENCRLYCSSGPRASQRYAYIGLQQGILCWCSHTLGPDAPPALAAPSCNAPCDGDACQLCGGTSDQIDIYYNPALDASAPRVKRQSADYGFIGCYNDEGNTKLLDETSYQDTNSLGVDDCVDFCRTSAGGQGSTGDPNAWLLAGVENGDSCYCANRFSTSDPVGVRERECDTVCDDPQDPTEFCGGGSSGLRLQVYQLGIPGI